MSDRIVKMTKRYIIDLLNSLCFSNTVSWDGVDNYNSFPLFSSGNESDPQEQRGFFLVDTRKPVALRVLITMQDVSMFKVCYRIKNIPSAIQFDNPTKICYPMSSSVGIDFSIADLNVGVEEVGAYSFSDNTTVDHIASQDRLFNLVKFILNSALVVKEDPDLFSDMLNELASQIPQAGDIHYKPVYEVVVE